jgi:hypothetical protein
VVSSDHLVGTVELGVEAAGIIAGAAAGAAGDALAFGIEGVLHVATGFAHFEQAVFGIVDVGCGGRGDSGATDGLGGQIAVRVVLVAGGQAADGIGAGLDAITRDRSPE